jgi:general secretion pathway protein F/type IV pilus assembly protein PilC
MPEFTYQARNLSGEIVEGTVVASTEREVVTSLSGQSLFPIKVAAQKKPNDRVIFQGRVNDQTVAVFYEQFATLMANGVPMVRSLTVLKEQKSSPALSSALEKVIARVEDGDSISDAFAQHPKIFSEMAINMSRAGAEGGFLEDALLRVSQFTEQQAELRSRTIGALIYPAVLACIGTIVVTVLLVFFVPKFGAMFDQLRQSGDLPAITEWLLWFSGCLQSYGIFLLLALLLAYGLVKYHLATPQGRKQWDGLKLKLPLFGPIFLNLAVARFCRVLGTLLKNGVPILKGLEISREASGNKVLSAAIEKAAENVTSGASLSVPLSKSGHFPTNVTEVISVSEESNTLDDVLVSVADNLEKNTLRKLDMMVKLIEPLMLVVMAGIIMVVVVALLLPIMKMGKTMQ